MQSRFKIFSLSALIVVMAAVTVSCTRPGVRFQNVGYNRGLEDSENKMLLLNAVRASKRYPMYFSASDSVNGKNTVDTRTQVNLPFQVPGPGTHIELNRFDVNPQLSTSSGISQHTMANLMTAKFMKAIISDIDVNQLQFYMEQGWPEELILFMLVQEVGIASDAYHKLIKDHQAICDRGYWNKKIYAPPRNYEAICRKIAEDLSDFEYRNCDRKRDLIVRTLSRKEKLGDGSSLELPVKVTVLKNDPRDECNYHAFSIFIRTMRLLKARIEGFKIEGGGFDVKRRITKSTSLSDVEGSTNDITDIQEPKSSTIVSKVVIEDPFDGRKPLSFGGKASQTAKSGYLALRSPRDMLYFLGSIISVQSRSHDPLVPTVLVGRHQHEVELFQLSRGIAGGLGSAVSVKHEGTVYSIPRPGTGDVAEHRSMQALALIRQFILKGVERDDLPQSSTLLVGG